MIDRNIRAYDSKREILDSGEFKILSVEQFDINEYKNFSSKYTFVNFSKGKPGYAHAFNNISATDLRCMSGAIIANYDVCTSGDLDSITITPISIHSTGYLNSTPLEAIEYVNPDEVEPRINLGLSLNTQTDEDDASTKYAFKFWMISDLVFQIEHTSYNNEKVQMFIVPIREWFAEIPYELDIDWLNCFDTKADGIHGTWNIDKIRNNEGTDVYALRIPATDKELNQIIAHKGESEPQYGVYVCGHQHRDIILYLPGYIYEEFEEFHGSLVNWIETESIDVEVWGNKYYYHPFA